MIKDNEITPDDENKEFVEEMTRRRNAENNERNKKYFPGNEEKTGLIGLLMKTYFFESEFEAKMGLIALGVLIAVVALGILIRSVLF